jgi:coiled-coil domain-containing protein 6
MTNINTIEPSVNENMSLEMDKLYRRNAYLEEELRRSREELVRFGSDAERNEERMTNKLLVRLGQLRQEKENLALSIEREEEMMTNTLQRKLLQLKQEKIDLENKLEIEQELIVNRLQKQLHAVQVVNPLVQDNNMDKVQLGNELEQEQAFVVNRLKEQVLTVKLEKEQMEQRMLDEMKFMLSTLESHLTNVTDSDTLRDVLEKEIRSMKDAVRIRLQKHQEMTVTDVKTFNTSCLNNAALQETLRSTNANQALGAARRETL